MSMFPNAAMYRWTYRDVADAAANRPTLTPYDLPATSFSAPKATTEGTSVPLPIEAYANVRAVNRFDFGADISWEPVPVVAAGATTLAELCRKLHATGSPRYADLFYKVDGMDLQQNAHFARLLFEHWDNTDYRYAVIMEDASEAERRKASRPYDDLPQLSEPYQQQAVQLLSTAATLESGYQAFFGSAHLETFQLQVSKMNLLHRQWLVDLESFKNALQAQGAEPKMMAYMNEAFGHLANRIKMLAG